MGEGKCSYILELHLQITTNLLKFIKFKLKKKLNYPKIKYKVRGKFLLYSKSVTEFQMKEYYIENYVIFF